MAKKHEDDREALYVRLPRWILERVRAEAALRELSAQDVLREVLVERYRPEARDARREA